MTWLLIALGAGAFLTLVTAWRRRARRRRRIGPAGHQAMADLYAIRRRLDVALFKLRLSRDMAEARRRLSAELDES
jgi:transposase-like protein